MEEYLVLLRIAPVSIQQRRVWCGLRILRWLPGEDLALGLRRWDGFQVKPQVGRLGPELRLEERPNEA